MDVKTACLGVLLHGEATGYEIKKLFEEGPYSYFFDAGFGSIYPALARLCEEGLATVRDVTEPGRPRRKVYSITAAGRVAFRAALAEPPAPDRCRSEWVFVAWFAELLPPELLRHRMDERLGWYRSAVDRIRACHATAEPPGRKFVTGLAEAMYAAAADYIEQHGPELIRTVSERTPTADAAE